MSTFDRISQSQEYPAGAGWYRIKTIDMHTAGEPLRVILSGYPAVEGEAVLAKRAYMKSHLDWLRTSLMFEPRGHADMYGCILTPPERKDSEFGVIFMHNEGYSTMCGHATIALGKLALEMGWVDRQGAVTEFNIDAPCGQIKVLVETQEPDYWVRFHCVPSFVAAHQLKDEIPGVGSIEYDIAYGGAFYAYVDAAQLNLQLDPGNYTTLKQTGMAIKKAVAEKRASLIQHPFEPDLSFLYGTIFVGESSHTGIHSRNVCVFADGEVDRSPTGSGVSGRMALHHSKGEVKTGESLRIESILGTDFTGKVVQEVDYGSYRAVIPEVGGTAFVVGQNEFLVDPRDPLKTGFILK